MVEKKGTTILRAEAENFRRLRFAHVENVSGEGLVKVTGKMAAGKTTVLRMVKEAFGGAGEVLPDPVNLESEDGKGFLLVELSNGYTIERRYTENAPKGYLTVTGPDGGRHTQAKLNEWLGPLAFDPLAFFGLKPERQREVLLSLGTDPELATRLQELKEYRARLYDERTPWISQKRTAAKVPRPEGKRPKPVDVSAATAKLDELQKMDRLREDAGTAIQVLEARLTNATEDVNAIRERMAELERELADGLDQVKDLTAGLQEAKTEYDGMTDPAADIAKTMDVIRSADAVTEALRPWEAWEAATAKVKEAEKMEKALTASIDAAKQEETQLISNAGIPVTGLAFSEDGEPFLNGLPLSSASGGEKIQLAVEVALASGSDLRVCLIDEANDLDLDGLERLDELAKAHGFQIWAARIGLEGPGEIVVEDGQATNRPE